MTAAAPGTRDLLALIEEAGLEPGRYPAVVRCWRDAAEQLDRARRICERHASPSAAAFACGSMGRREFTPSSDLDVAFVFGPAGDEPEAARLFGALRSDLVTAGFDVSAKDMFGSPIALDALTSDIGGSSDGPRTLTFRALILTEGEWLCSPEVAQDYRTAILQAYSGREVSRGRYLTSLTNDLHRYYRTVCVEYRWKADEKRDGGWAIRNMKLRHSRKLWRLATICAECAAFLETQGQPTTHDALLSEKLRSPSSLSKVLDALALMGAQALAGPLLAPYDRFLGWMRDAAVRERLEALRHDQRDGDEVFKALRENARAFDDACQQIVWAFLRHENVARHLLRFGLL